MNEEDLINYPFLRTLAREYITEISLPLDDFLSNNIENVKRASEIIKGILENRGASSIDFENARDRVILYALTKILLTYMGDYFISARYALWERNHLYNLLEKEDFEVIRAIARELKIEITQENGEFSIPITSFLKYSTVFNDPDLNLCNQMLDSGKVIVNSSIMRKIVREAFYSQFLDDVTKPVEFSNTAREILEPYSREIISMGLEIKREISDLGPRNVKAFPPCMVKIMDDVSKNANLSHPARFYMVTFLHKIGYDNEEIIKLFGNIPDFAEKITRYQVEHITGTKRGREYQVPSCQTLGSLGLCYKETDELCMSGRIKHPLQYYRIKNSDRR